MSPGPRPTSIPSSILIHQAASPEQTWPENWGLCPFGGAGAPFNTMWPGPRPTCIPSGIVIHPAVWPQQIWAENWGLLYPSFFMAALRSRCGHYISILWFLSSFSFFFSSPIISAVADWCGLSANLECRSEMCCTRLAGNTGRKIMQKIAICAPLHEFVGLNLLN